MAFWMIQKENFWSHLNKEWVTKSQSTLEILAESIIKETNETIAKFGYINHENCKLYC